MYLFNIIYLFLFLIKLFFFLLCFNTNYIKKIYLICNQINQKAINYTREIKNFKLSITKSLIPTIKIDSLYTNINYLIFQKPKKFILWKSLRITDDYKKLNSLIFSVTKFNVYIKFLKINYQTRISLKIYGLNILKLKKTDFIRVKIQMIKIYFDNKFFGKIEKIRVTIKPDKPTIYINSVNILFTKSLLDEYFVDFLKNIIQLVSSDEKSEFPNFMIKQFCMNVYLNNYIRINSRNITIEQNILNIYKTDLRIWKKKSIWIDNINFGLLETTKKPKIENIRLRLFKSTGDKLYKSLIVLRKRFMPIIPKYRIKKFKKKELVVHPNYIHSLNKNEICVSNRSERDIIIDEYLDIINEFIIKFNIYIINLEIKLSYDDGTIIAENIKYTHTEKKNILSFKSWKFYRKNITFIEKNDDENKNFTINFNKKILNILPYNMNIYFDLFWFKKMGSILKNNISRLGHVFYSKFYSYNKGYVYEVFRVDSFSANFNYKKTKKKILSLLGGNKTQILNYLDVEDINILLNNVDICYPRDWTYVAKKISKVYRNSIYNNNFKSIVSKISNENVSNVLYIRKNWKYFKKKIFNTIDK